MRFGAKITHLLSKNRLTQAQLAEALGVSQPSVARWEKGAKPHPSTALAIAQYFGISEADLMDDERSLTPLGGASGIESIPAFIQERREIAAKLRLQAEAWWKWADELDPEGVDQARRDLAEITRRAMEGEKQSDSEERKRA